jgi:hypothetical protein
MHSLDAGQQDPHAMPGFEAEHWPGHPFDRTVILFDNVIQVFAPAEIDRRLVIGVVATDRCSVRAAFVDRDRVGVPVVIDCSLEKTARSSFISACRQ